MDHNFDFTPDSSVPGTSYTFPAPSAQAAPPPSSSSSSLSGSSSQPSTPSFLSRNPSYLLAARPKFTTVLRGASYNKGKQPSSAAFDRSASSSREEQGRTHGLDFSTGTQNRPSTSSSSQTVSSSSSFSRPRPSRRGSHPLSVRSKVQQETDDAEFIKRAFDNLSIEPGQTDLHHGDRPAPVVTVDSGRQMNTAESDVTLMEMLENDDPLGVGVSIRRVSRANHSKASLASSLSPPASALSYMERASAASTRSLLPSSNNNNNGTQSSSSGYTPTSTYQPRHSESSYAWSDPFDDARRLRRRSTISGYSVSSADWNSLRRGSLASLAGEYQATHSRSASIAPGGPGDVLPGDAAGSLRWEAWATAYRESVLNRLEPLPEPGDYAQQTHTSAYGHHLAPPLRPVRARTSRLSSITSDFNAGAHSIQEHGNLFYPLRRQFLAKHGSRSERNRILIIELCHALEEFSREMVNVWERSSLDVSNAGSEEAVDMSDIELVANEVDSLIREIIEAVPAFSYALGQGNYGPLPFSIHHLTASTPDLPGRAYLVQIQAIPDVAEADPDMLLAPPESSWWPTRLRADLNEGLLTETGEDSPALSIMQTAVLGAHAAAGQMEIGRPEPEKNDVLLEEGRRRWLEYKEARRR